MSFFDDFIVRVKRGETPMYRRLRTLAKMLLRPPTPRIPRIFKPPVRLVYELHFGIIVLVRQCVNFFYRHPLFQSRCATIGRNLSLDGLPFVSGHVEIHIGDDVWLGGKISITSGRFVQRPRLEIGDRTEIGWNVLFTVNQEVVIEEDVLISYDCRISDSDGHPKAADLRKLKAPLTAKDMRPVRICRNAWIGNGSHIMKGVTIGEGAIIGANSVVITDIPPFSLALGNPAEVYFRNAGRPSRKPGVTVPDAGNP